MIGLSGSSSISSLKTRHLLDLLFYCKQGSEFQLVHRHILQAIVQQVNRPSAKPDSFQYNSPFPPILQDFSTRSVPVSALAQPQLNLRICILISSAMIFVERSQDCSPGFNSDRSIFQSLCNTHRSPVSYSYLFVPQYRRGEHPLCVICLLFVE